MDATTTTTTIITRDEALCFIYMLDFTPSNVRVCKQAIERASVEICYQEDPRFPILLPKLTFKKAAEVGIVKGYPEEVNIDAPMM